MLTAVSDWLSHPNELLAYLILPRTNRRLHALCTPFLRRDLNLLTQSISYDKFALEQASKYSQHIRTIRFFLDHRYPSGDSNDYRDIHEKCIEQILSLCTQADSISIYYHCIYHIPIHCRPTDNFAERLFDLITAKNRAPVKSLGVYCLPLLQDSGFPDPSTNIVGLLNRVISSPDAVRSLEHFDVVAHYMSPSLFPSLPNLQSFSLYRSWASGFDEFWTTQQLSTWIQQSSLVRLQLINCTHFHADDIPECIVACPSLQQVMISACGRKYPVQPQAREKGWSKKVDALSNKRPPLLSLHLEYVEHSDMLAFGTIPTLQLSIGSAHEGHVEKAFWEDKELFPHLQKLSLEKRAKPRYRNRSEQNGDDHTQRFEVICKERSISLERNASWLVNRLFWNGYIGDEIL
jgi:hypothetical protein